MADVSCYVGGGGLRTFTGFDTNTQTFVYQLYDQTRLTRTGGNSYEMLWPDGAKLIFNQSDGSIGTSRKIFLTQILDPQGNALTLTYDTNLLLVAVTDAIGQVTTLTYGLPAGTVDGIDMPADPYKLIRVTDPFGRFASFDYRPVQIGETFFIFNGQIMDLRPMYAWALSKITDVIGLTSQFTYVMTDLILQNNVERVYRTFINSLVTPYGTTTFSQGSTNTTRWLETRYPDGSRDRVEFNQTVAIQSPEPDYKVPVGMGTVPNGFLESRNTFYWSRNACATAYGDYFKATIYHWLHASDISSCSGILESLKKPLEARLWLNYVDSAGQFTGFVVGPNNQPAHAGRVLDDGTSQVCRFADTPVVQEEDARLLAGHVLVNRDNVDAALAQRLQDGLQL